MLLSPVWRLCSFDAYLSRCHSHWNHLCDQLEKCFVRCEAPGFIKLKEKVVKCYMEVGNLVWTTMFFSYAFIMVLLWWFSVIRKYVLWWKHDGWIVDVTYALPEVTLRLKIFVKWEMAGVCPWSSLSSVFCRLPAEVIFGLAFQVGGQGEELVNHELIRR